MTADPVRVRAAEAIADVAGDCAEDWWEEANAAVSAVLEGQPDRKHVADVLIRSGPGLLSGDAQRIAGALLSRYHLVPRQGGEH